MEKDFSFLHYLKTVSSDDQAYEGLDSEQLWLFYISETDVLGPFRQNDIIKLIPQYRHEFAPLKACTVSQKEWKPFFNHSCFNGRDLTRDMQPKTKFRKPELIADRYLCLVNGIKKGPFSQNQISELIHTKEIKADALISADEGMTWHRAYSYPQFNRRTKQIVPEHQITMPDDAIEKTKLIVLDKIKRANDSQDSGAVSAALLSGKNKHLASEKINNIFAQKLQKVSNFSLGGKSNTNGKKTNPLFAIGLVMSLVVLLLIDSGSKDKETHKRDPLEVLQGSKKSRRTSAKYEDQSAPTPITNYEDSEANVAKKRKTKNSDNADVIAEEESVSTDQEEFNQDPNEYDDSQSRKTSRGISSKKRKATKKLSVSHQEEDPNDGLDQEEEDLDSGSASVEDETAEDFELEE